MAARLGNVFYWAANAVALLFLLPGRWGWFLMANRGYGGYKHSYCIGSVASGPDLSLCSGRAADEEVSHCAEFIKHEAVVCKYCGSELVSSKDTIDDFIAQAAKAHKASKRHVRSDHVPAAKPDVFAVVGSNIHWQWTPSSRASGTGTAALIQLKPINPTSTPAAPGKCWSWLPQVAMLYTMFGSRMDVLNEPAIFAPI